MRLPTGLLHFREVAAPSAPSTGQAVMYVKADGILYSKDDAGVERPVTHAGYEVGQLSAVSTPADADEFHIVNGGTSKRMSLNQLTSYIESRGRQHNASTSSQTPAAATDVYIAGSDVLIPAGRLQAKSKFRLDMAITKGAAGTGTPTFNIRVGTAGAVADASRCLFTWPAANTAVADEMHVLIMCTFRSVGSGTSTVIEGELKAEHELTTTGFGGTGLGANIIINTTGGGFDSTVANLKIGASVNGGTASAWTIRQCHAVLENLA